MFEFIPPVVLSLMPCAKHFQTHIVHFCENLVLKLKKKNVQSFLKSSEIALNGDPSGHSTLRKRCYNVDIWLTFGCKVDNQISTSLQHSELKFIEPQANCHSYSLAL